MIRHFITIILILFCVNSFAQEIETYYYNKEGKPVNQVFASFYRVVSIPTEANPDKMFRDFFMTGKLKGEGYYLSVDKNNANNCVFDRECIFYREDGSIEKRFTMRNGKYTGTYVEFTENGDEFVEYEYADGEYANKWYYRANKRGSFGRFSIATGKLIPEEFDLHSQWIDWVDGTPWVSYNVNGLTISMAVRKGTQYGQYHEVSVVISNSSFEEITLEPSEMAIADAANSLDELLKKPSERQVYSYDEYMQKVSNRQAFQALAMGLASAASAISSAFSPSSNTMSINVNGTTTYVSAYGNSINVYTPDLEFAGVSESWAQDRKVIQRGYLKKNTVYPGETISGYFNVKRNSENFLKVSIFFNNKEIPFYWNIKDFEDIATPVLPDAFNPKKKEETSATPISYSSDDYTWMTKLHNISVWSIKVKKSFRIEIYDPNKVLVGKEFLIVDGSGEHYASVSSSNSNFGHFTMIESSDLDIQMPFNIICEDDTEYNIVGVRQNTKRK